MGYTVHNFQPNEVLHASELNEMDAQILKNVQNTATIQTTNVAVKNYEVGEYLTYEGILYEVTSPIATGGTITPGSNCEQTNMGAELTAANAEIASVRESLSTNVITESVLSPAISITAGTIGTFAKVDSVSVAKSGYTPIQVSLNNVGHPGLYSVVPVLRTQTSTLYFIYYRVTSSAGTQNAGDVEVNVTYIKS